VRVLAGRLVQTGSRPPCSAGRGEATLLFATSYFEGRTLTATAPDQFNPPSGAADTPHWKRRERQRGDALARRRCTRLSVPVLPPSYKIGR
jgi:hypothetical protein